MAGDRLTRLILVDKPETEWITVDLSTLRDIASQTIEVVVLLESSRQSAVQRKFAAWAAILADMPPVLKSGLLKRIGTILLEDDEERLEQLIEYLNQLDIDAANTPPAATNGTAADEGGSVD